MQCCVKNVDRLHSSENKGYTKVSMELLIDPNHFVTKYLDSVPNE